MCRGEVCDWEDVIEEGGYVMRMDMCGMRMHTVHQSRNQTPDQGFKYHSITREGRQNRT